MYYLLMTCAAFGINLSSQLSCDKIFFCAKKDNTRLVIIIKVGYVTAGVAW